MPNGTTPYMWSKIFRVSSPVTCWASTRTALLAVACYSACKIDPRIVSSKMLPDNFLVVIGAVPPSHAVSLELLSSGLNETAASCAAATAPAEFAVQSIRSLRGIGGLRGAGRAGAARPS